MELISELEAWDAIASAEIIPYLTAQDIYALEVAFPTFSECEIVVFGKCICDIIQKAPIYHTTCEKMRQTMINALNFRKTREPLNGYLFPLSYEGQVQRKAFAKAPADSIRQNKETSADLYCI